MEPQEYHRVSLIEILTMHRKVSPITLGALLFIVIFGIFIWMKPITLKEIPVQGSGDGVMCAQVITPARNIKTGEIKDFPTPCDIPEGWVNVNIPTGNPFESTDSNNSVSLKIGQTAKLANNLSLKLISVNDSRCTVGTQCIWAGTVTAKIELFKDSVSLGQAEVEINKEVSINDYKINLLSVSPSEKKSGTQMSEYTLNFIVSN